MTEHPMQAPNPPRLEVVEEGGQGSQGSVGYGYMTLDGAGRTLGSQRNRLEPNMGDDETWRVKLMDTASKYLFLEAAPRV